MNLLFVSTANKYGFDNIPSASEDLIQHLYDSFPIGFTKSFYSFRGKNLPLPDGKINRHEGGEVSDLVKMVDVSDIIVFGGTAYWGSLSSSSKAFFEYLAETDYGSFGQHKCLLQEKFIIPLIVGVVSDDVRKASTQLVNLKARLGFDMIETTGFYDVRRNNINIDPVIGAVAAIIKSRISTNAF